MKTLDEVIAELEDEGLFADALYYLKHLQEYYNMSREHHEPNPALTWEQLKQMEGKPVWVEEQYALSKDWHGAWHIVDMLHDGEFWDEEEKELLTTDEDRFRKDGLGKTWQAYRKERG